jgi:hypothetical protein
MVRISPVLVDGMTKRHKIVTRVTNFKPDKPTYEEYSITEDDIRNVIDHLQERIIKFQFNNGPVEKGYIVVPELMYRILEYYFRSTESGRVYFSGMDSFCGFKIIQGDTLQAVIGWERR